MNTETTKNRNEYYSSYYQKNKEKKQQSRRERYQRQKEQSERQLKEKSAKIYSASSIKIFLSLKDYTEFNQEKKKLWANFTWTLKDFNLKYQEGFTDIASIMKLETSTSKLIRDYWETAKNKEKQKSKSWNSLTEAEQERLIKYWAYEKVRMEQGYIDNDEKLQRQSKEYLKEIEMAKFHEERGKINCQCWQCQEKKEIRLQNQNQLFNSYELEPQKTKKQP